MLISNGIKAHRFDVFRYPLLLKLLENLECTRKLNDVFEKYIDGKKRLKT